MMLTNLTFLGKKEILVTAASIIAESFEFNRARELMEEQFSLLGEDKYAYVSQGKRKLGEINIICYARHMMYFHLVGFFQIKIIYFALIQSKLSH